MKNAPKKKLPITLKSLKTLKPVQADAAKGGMGQKTP